MRAVLQKHNVAYHVSRVQSDDSVNEWMVVVRYADQTAYDKALGDFGHDAEHRQVVAEISNVVTFISRRLVEELDL